MRLLLLVLLLSGLKEMDACCQPTAGSLDVPRTTDTLPVLSLLARMDQMQEDTVKLKTFIELSRYYWRLGKGRNLDTCLAFARKAYALGMAIHSASAPPEAVFMQAKVLAERNEMAAAGRVLVLLYGEQRVRVLLVLAEQYINHKPVDLGYLDHALPYAERALSLADSIHSDRWRNECLLLLGKYYFEKGDIKKGEGSILAIISACRQTGNRKLEAHYWSELDLYMPRTDSTYAEHVRACRNAYNLYVETGEERDALFAFRDWAWLELAYDHIDMAERKFDTVVSMFRSLQIEPTPSTYLYLAELSLCKSDFPQVISDALKALPGLRPTDQRKLFALHHVLSESYLRLGKTDDALRYGRLAMDIATANNFPDMFYATRLISDAMIRKDSTEGALLFLRRFEKEHPPHSPLQEQALSYSYAAAYDHLGEYANAERYFLRMIRLAPAAEKELRHNIFNSACFSPTEIAVSIAEFYIRRGKNREARSILLQAIHNPWMAREAEDRRMIELLLFQTCLALGDTRAALFHHKRYVTLNDSIFNVEKLKQFQTLQVRYETRQTEQSLQLLQLQSQKEETRLRNTSRQRNIILGGAILLFLLILLVFRGYQLKRRALRKVEAQQQVIQLQNQMQQQLLGEKDRLLVEKDLLMQEIHHRVKNNLNIIISLLESQSLYLNNDVARAALQDTQNRVHAVFLLHKKLYATTTEMEVDANLYVSELVSHLCETFETTNNGIVITHRIEPVAILIDAGEMLPVAVIINEAVTNAIKHAFPAGRKGHIHLWVTKDASGTIRLQIKDNGVGLPPQLQPDDGHSLGLFLINGLVKQLHGSWTIENEGGVVLTVQFPCQHSIKFSKGLSN